VNSRRANHRTEEGFIGGNMDRRGQSPELHRTAGLGVG
jgi:hypothetical protein